MNYQYTYMTVEASLSIAREMFELNHRPFNAEAARDLIMDWYCHSDITDPYKLAACALADLVWTPASTYQDVLDAWRYWFPEDPSEKRYPFDPYEHL